jgi:hypothetical protein
MKKQKGFTLVEMIFIPLILILIVGYGMNLHKLTQCDFEAPYKAEILHGVGIFPPVGIFTGWMNFGK